MKKNEHDFGEENADKNIKSQFIPCGFIKKHDLWILQKF